MNSPPADLRVPKHAVRVELCYAGGTTQPAELFLEQHEERPWRGTDVCDLLEQPPAFAPARDTQSGAFMLVNKNSLAWVRVDEPHREDLLDESELFELSRGVRIELWSAAPITGELLYSPLPGHARTADFLNEPGRFFPLWSANGLCFIAKSHVMRVYELLLPGTAR